MYAMKNSHIAIILVTLFFLDGCWTGILRWVIFKMMSTGIIGATFSTLVDFCAYHPKIWESSINLLSQPSSSELKFDCPPGEVYNILTPFQYTNKSIIKCIHSYRIYSSAKSKSFPDK